jgi:primary-amine oxidase
MWRPTSSSRCSSHLDKTFVVERKPNPLNPLTAAEIKATLEVLKASGQFKPGHRFTEMVLKAPPKDQVWAHALEGQPVQAPRQAAFVILDGRHLIEGTVDLASKKVVQWQPVPGAHGMVLIDDSARCRRPLKPARSTRRRWRCAASTT